MNRRIRHALLASAAIMLLIGVTPTVAGAGDQLPELTGEVSCDNGDQIVVWTLTNFFDSFIDLSDGTMTVNDGTPVDLTFAPNPLPALGTSTAQATVDGTEVGVADGAVTINLQGPEVIIGMVTLEGCPQPATTTTTAAPTSTTVAPAAQPLRLQPAFTG
jgi:hypothetical protein